MNYQTLNSDEKTRLITIILNSVDECIEFDDFQETICLLSEDIPGLECLSDDSLSALVMDCWEIFRHPRCPFQRIGRMLPPEQIQLINLRFNHEHRQ